MLVTESGMVIDWMPLPWKARGPMLILVTLVGSLMIAGDEEQHCRKASASTVSRVADPDE